MILFFFLQAKCFTTVYSSTFCEIISEVDLIPSRRLRPLVAGFRICSTLLEPVISAAAILFGDILPSEKTQLCLWITVGLPPQHTSQEGRGRGTVPRTAVRFDRLDAASPMITEIRPKVAVAVSG